MANTTIAVTPGSGSTVAVYSDASSQLFQRVLNAPDGSQEKTYFANYKAVSAGTSATTNILTFAGAASTIVKVTRITVSATATTAAAIFDLCVNRQTAVDTGGTAATTATIIKAAVADAAATAVAPLFYTAGPTAGTTTGTLASFKLFAPITATGSTFGNVVEVLGAPGRNSKPITLTSATDIIALTLNGATPANATSFDIHVEWTEVAA
jgi:hypothetical protein